MIAPRKKKLAAPETDALDEAEIKAAKAKAEKEFRDQRKKKQLEGLIAFEVQELERKEDPTEDEIFIRVVLPEFCDRIWLDGVVYLHGWTGRVPRSKYLTMQDCMARAWEHKFDVEGMRLPNKRPAVTLHLGDGDEGVNAHSLLRRRV